MSSKLKIATYADGECTCSSCGSPLPGHETWSGARFRYCGSAACTAALRQHENGRYVAPCTVRCGVEGCIEFVPEGFYNLNAALLCCSSRCWQQHCTKQKEHLLCSCGCGEQVQRPRYGTLQGLIYLSAEHQARHKHELFFEQAFGSFRPVVEEYFTDFAQMHYRDLASVRSALGRLFRFLNETGCKSLDEVNSDTITKFLVWLHKNSSGVKTDILTCISTFFKWLQCKGKRSTGNPVNRFLHQQKKPQHLPRPLSDGEQKAAWEILHERGDARLRLAFAIGEESGMRIGEICRIRLSDVDTSGQRIFVRLPNKKNRERYAFFGAKTATYLREWLAERDSSCGHDHLLYNYWHRKTPFNTGSLGRALSRVLCKTYAGEALHERGFDKWSTHRLRHTMSTNLLAGGADAAVLMAAGGWHNADTMAGYTKINDSQAKHGYERAMRRADQQQREAPKTRVLTPQEFLQLRRGAAREVQNSETERCV